MGIRIKNPELKTIKANWEGNYSFDNSFSNHNQKEHIPTTFRDILKWKFSKNPLAEEKKNDPFKLKVIKNSDFISSKEDMIVWLGHATFFIRLNGITMITDPVLYNVSMIKRMTDLPLKPKELNNIDYLLLSHGHRDHYDKKSIKTLHHNNPKLKALIPLKTKSWFDKISMKSEEAGWYQQYNVNDIAIFFMPAKHWNRRGLNDFNRTLWGSFIIQYKNTSLFFAGDTAFGPHFKEIAEFFPAINYCILPVGAYRPAHIMKHAHLSPTEALQAFKDLNGEVFIPMHYGTFDLSDEPPGEPKRILENNKQNLRVQYPDIGEIIKI